ncbi:HD domain-containing phosphohydrolase [uncultured Paraglaciecola sp.]|uniref:HD-GYP domain-containing protein n=1 Tax=uncultured Paraglaciecola sp. TaxID=1765024 RepID=UPI0030D9B1A9|tara:strand:- start:109397 stop:110563 length:1167 start_codon:yes stop_codon:yes gene_type:complete
MLQLINIDALLPGMFIIRVTKQVGKIKVASAGKVNDEQDITELAEKGILQVQIDISKSTHLTSHQDNDDTYVNASGLSYNQQLAHSLALHDQAKLIQGRLIKRVAKGKIADLEEIDNITQQIVNKAFECDDALAITTLLKQNDEYFLEHSINCAILMVMFGRALKIENTTLQHLGAGALLMDIGMVKLPLLLTQKAGSLSPQDTLRMQRHVDIALQLLEPIEDVDEVSLVVIKQHQERLDGTGYPDGLRGEKISQYGRMAAIVDTYDSLITTRPYREASRPADALIKMQNENLGLDKELLSQFIGCIGANPIGSLVKLASSKLAMVIRLNPLSPLSPVVMVFYNLTTQLDEVVQIDLTKVDDEIVASVSPDDFGIRLSEFLHHSFFNT